MVVVVELGAKAHGLEHLEKRTGLVYFRHRQEFNKQLGPMRYLQKRD